MTNPLRSTVDQTVLTEVLSECRDRLYRIQHLLHLAPQAVSEADWLEIYDCLDRVKDQADEVLRPAPRSLVDAYVRTRTWLRELHPRLRKDARDAYARRQLAALLLRLERELREHAAV